MTRLGSLTLVLGLMLVACGGDDDGARATTGTTDTTGTGGAGGSSGSGGSTTSGSGAGGSAPIGGIIPDDRRMDWSVAGVPGGIPELSTVCATVGPGNPDDTAAVQAALDGCPDGQVVHVTAGSYVLSGPVINTNRSVVIRGDGPGATVFSAASGTAFKLGNAADWPPPPANIPIASGATKGSAEITVADTSAFQVGGLMRVEAGDNPPFVHNLGVSEYDAGLSMTFRVEAVTPTTVTFSPPLPFDFSPYTPLAAAFAIPPLTSAGLEDFTIDLQGTGSYGIEVTQAWGSWVQNVEIVGSSAHSLTLYTVVSSEIRRCNIHDAVSTGPNTEGLDFYRNIDWNLIEDNIVYDAGGLVLGDWQGGNAGNVIAYNFLYGASTPDPSVAGYDVDLSHGSNIVLNLLEGNLIGQVEADGYFGSTSHGTLFRNWITATHPSAPNNLAAIKLKHFSDYFNVVGNVLGTDAFPTTNHTETYAYGGFYDAPTLSSYDDGWTTGVQVIYELGFPNAGNTGYTGTIPASDPIDYSSQGADLASAQALDLNVAATLLRHGNFDYFNRDVVWDPSIAQHELPESLFRSSKPAFFGDLAWPPFDPSSPPKALDDAACARLPACQRHLDAQP